MKARITVNLDEEMAAKLRYIAREELRSVSGELRHLVILDVEAYEDEYGPIKLPEPGGERQ